MLYSQCEGSVHFSWLVYYTRSDINICLASRIDKSCTKVSGSVTTNTLSGKVLVLHLVDTGFVCSQLLFLFLMVCSL